MSFQELNKYKKRFPSLKEKISNIELYLKERLSSTISMNLREAQRVYIDPDIIASRENISVEEASALLNLFRRSGILKAVWKVYCPTNEKHLLGEYLSVDAMPPTLTCEYHDFAETFAKDDYLVELGFYFSEEYLAQTKFVR